MSNAKQTTLIEFLGQGNNKVLRGALLQARAKMLFSEIAFFFGIADNETIYTKEIGNDYSPTESIEVSFTTGAVSINCKYKAEGTLIEGIELITEFYVINSEGMVLDSYRYKEPKGIFLGSGANEKLFKWAINS